MDNLGFSFERKTSKTANPTEIGQTQKQTTKS